MKAEKIILSFVAVFLGLIVAGGLFFFYQSTKTIPESKIKTLVIHQASPTPAFGLFLSIESPADETVVTDKNVTVTGKTTPDATVVIITPTDQQVVKPTRNGDFSISTTIDSDTNIIHLTAIAPNGEETKQDRTITFSTEQF